MVTLPPKHRAVTLFILVLTLSAVLPIHSHERPNQKPIVVEVHRTRDQLAFKLEPDPAPGKDVLAGLSMLAGQRGAGYPVLALVDDNAKIRDLDQVAGIAAKAGFHNIRTFIVRHGAGKMVEVKFCAALPISAAPPAESACDSAKGAGAIAPAAASAATEPAETK
jgi:biopolymer transport protein ExbD